MRIIISPAKKMHEDADSLEPLGPPRFLPEAERLLSVLRPMPLRELKALWQCSDAIAALNAKRLRRMDLRGRLTPAEGGLRLARRAAEGPAWERT